MLNHITIMGRLTKEVEAKNAGERVVVNNTVAVSRDFVRDGQPETDFIDIAVWGKDAERLAKHLTKGSMIIVEGRLQIDNYTDREGKSRSRATVVASNWYFGERKAADGTKDKEDAPQAAQPDVGEEVEFPF